jgi:urea transport system ATP-binding protein
MLTVEGLDVAYGRAQVLFNVSLEVPPGALVCVMGRNGVGKTTLLHAVMGILSPRAGRILFQGNDITRTKTHDRVRLGLGYVPQGHGTFPQMTVAENLSVVLEASARSDRSVIDESLDLFPALVPLLKRKAGFLSGGQQQQLAIARALVTRPVMLLLDEPTEGIQPSVILEIEDTIERLHKQVGLPILLVEQYLDLALRLADQFVVLDAGEVVRAGGKDDLRDESIQRLLSV